MLLLCNKFLLKAKKIIIVIQYFIAGKSRKIYFLKTTPMVDQSKRDCKLPLLVPCIEQWSLADGQGTLSMKEDASFGKTLHTSFGEKTSLPLAGRVAK